MGSACQIGASAKADAFIFSKTLLKTNILHISTRTFFYFMHARAQKKCARTRMFVIFNAWLIISFYHKIYDKIALKRMPFCCALE